MGIRYTYYQNNVEMSYVELIIYSSHKVQVITRARIGVLFKAFNVCRVVILYLMYRNSPRNFHLARATYFGYLPQGFNFFFLIFT